jgi:predicted short-subunit dehydrogenase-like oxidoreductase (DUF2520 family)
MDKTFALFGCGKAGISVSLALKSAGWTVAGCGSRGLASAEAGAQWLACPVLRIPEELPPGTPLMLGVPEQALPEVDHEIASRDEAIQGRVIFHLSGAVPSRVLTRCRIKGAKVGSLHPLMILPDPLSGALALRSATFAVEGRPEALAVIRAMALAISGKCIALSPHSKVLYHAAAVTAANHLVALLWESQALLARAGVRPEEALPAFQSLVEGTVKNVYSAGPVASLTGPVERGDIGMVRNHLSALKRWPQSRERYRVMALAAVALARHRHPERSLDYDALEKLLS